MSCCERLFAGLMARSDRRQDRLYGARKRALFAGLGGTVLEIGPGTGPNLAYYPDGIRWIGAEPNRHMHPHILRRGAGRALEVDLRTAPAEALDLPDASVDAVVSTLVLCSVASTESVLAEVRRVLRPGGRFLFIEHVAAPEGTLLRRVQRAARPLWRLVAGGCRPDRETGRAIKAAGFGDVRCTSFRLALPLPVTPHIAGVATKT